ncbi:hypothetical protein GYMLUDRAFT_257891 [Collybiopsis luxurians FD-317 M1]|nr:hypothetical protein GYMLUDRAFT_257891 [Collybiopsis luxurians FD-317 M1]
MTAYYVQIEIDANQLPLLKDPDFPYALCIARQVGENYNVVWKATKNITPINYFTCSSEFEVFASDSFEDDVLVRARSNYEAIKVGQQCILDQYGVMKPATDDPNHPKKGTFKVINQGPAFNIGVRAKVDGEFKPVYVTPGKVIKGASFPFEPLPKFVIWFSLDYETSSMFWNIDGPYIIIDFSDGQTNAKIDYRGLEPGDGDWFLVPNDKRTGKSRGGVALPIVSGTRRVVVQGYEALGVEALAGEAQGVEPPVHPSEAIPEPSRIYAQGLETGSVSTE